ncbi:MAG: hypothetical protein P8J87_19670 [Verrucomicrobiales bacterium]|nr:hypothetical protein [Verrucomicrobiales bacterium]
MKLSILTTASFALLIPFAANGAAPVISVDQFLEAQGGSNAASIDYGPTAAASAIGGNRTIETVVTTNTFSGTQAANSGISGDLFVVSQGSGVTGTVGLSYAFTPTDVTSGGLNSHLVFTTLEADQDVQFQATIFNGGNSAVSTLTIDAVALPGERIALPLVDFVPTGDTLANILAGATAIDLLFTPPTAGDFVIDAIEFDVIPEPSRALLALAGLMVGGLVRRRRA